MRVPIIATVCGLLAITAIAAPMASTPDVRATALAPAGKAVPEMAQASADFAGNVMRVSSLSEPKPRQPIDFDNLIRIDGNDYDVTYSENFSDEVKSLSTVRKISFGRVEEVSIITTQSGTYSTDGLASRHIRYPDIDTQRARQKGYDGLQAGVWHRGFGWLPQTFGPANSIITYGRIEGGGKFISGDGSTCFRAKSYYTCN